MAALGPDHVSWYELDVVPGTRLARRIAGDDGAGEEQAELYRRIVAGLGRLGYDWYEVSNFARSGKRSRHNLAYWRGRPYLGLGPSAVSTVGALRWRNVADVDRYLRAWTQPSAGGVGGRPSGSASGSAASGSSAAVNQLSGEPGCG